jgi:hypothetical protein
MSSIRLTGSPPKLSAIEKEKSIGPVSVYLLAEDSIGEITIIENQLTKTVLSSLKFCRA